jgi:hypothetical protein
MATGRLRPKVTVQVANQARVIEAIGTQLRPKLRREADVMGREMVEECIKIVQETTERRPVERRKVNTTHLDQSFTYRVDTSGGQIRSVLTIKSGVNKKKVAALMFGTKHPYKIAPRLKPRLTWLNKDGTRTRLKNGQIVHRNPKAGTIEYDGINAMALARDRVVRRRRGRRV